MKQDEPKLLRISKAAHELGLHPFTVRKWIKQGKIAAIRIGQEARVPRSEIERLAGKTDGRVVILYGRVSGYGQKDDLDIQLQRLQVWAATERQGQDTLVLSDIGSGLKASRKQLQRLLKLVCEDKVGEVAITYEDRLTRFGQEYLETLFACFGVTLTVLEPGEEKTPEQELTDDLLALIASFSGRLYGMRSHKQKELFAVRDSRDQQSLSYPLRLPDEIQAEALRLLDRSREVINLTVTALWDRLDAFALRTNPYAYKQVEEMIAPPLIHGHRQWRCEAEQAGRILRGQAERKQQFALILPLLEQGMVQPKTDTRRAGKNRKSIKQALVDLREAHSDGGHAVELQSLIEQACNFYLANGCFPDHYEEMQQVPVLKAGILPYAGDDGPHMGQTYRMSYDLDQKLLTLALRTPNAQGKWDRRWRAHTIQMSLPDLVVQRAKAGTPLAPTLREMVEADGTRYAVLDFIVDVPVPTPPTFEETQTVLGFDWGVRVLVTASVVDLDGHQIGHPLFLDTGPFDGRQARLRRQIDQLKAKVSRLEVQCDRFAVGDRERQPSEEALSILRREISRCWRKYEARNNDLGHLAANILLVLATAFDCKLIAGESLKSMKSAGRGKGTKGRWRNWRNNTQVRGTLWRILRYKCFLSGLRLEWQKPRHTSHVCPRCGNAANTYASPDRRAKVVDWGAWLCCSHPDCLWNGSRDYAASLNIARLGAALCRHAQTTRRVKHPMITDPSVQPVSYMGMRAALRLPPLSLRGHLIHSGRLYCNGWCLSVKLRSSYATPIMLRLCG